MALERCRLARGAFPESLDALAPQFIAKVPHDVIGGQPLKYRREADGSFVLYSVGWNEKDDGGVAGFQQGWRGGHSERRLGLAVCGEGRMKARRMQNEECRMQNCGVVRAGGAGVLGEHRAAGRSQ